MREGGSKCVCERETAREGELHLISGLTDQDMR